MTNTQIKMIQKFVEDTIDTDHYISVRAAFSIDMSFSLSMFANRPDVYFGIYSSKDRKIVSEPCLPGSDDVFEELLKVLANKYAHATTRKSPVMNKELALAWMEYFNKTVSGEAEKYSY